MNGEAQHGEVGSAGFAGVLSAKVIRGNASALRRIIDYFILLSRRITYRIRSKA